MPESALFLIRCLDDQTQANLEIVRQNVLPPRYEEVHILVAAIRELASRLDEANAKLAMHLARHRP